MTSDRHRATTVPFSPIFFTFIICYVDKLNLFAKHSYSPVTSFFKYFMLPIDTVLLPTFE